MDDNVTVSQYDPAVVSKLNKKNARLSMTKVTLLLFVITILSYGENALVTYIVTNCSDALIKGVVNLLCAFGVESSVAFVSAKAFLSSSVFVNLLDIAAVLLTMLLPFVIFAKKAELSFDECFNTDGKMVKGILFMFCFCQLITTFALTFSQSFYDFLLPSPVYSDTAAVATAGFDVFAFILRLLCVSVVVPLVEEYAFRGVIFSYLKKHGLEFAIVASAVIFGIAHSSVTQSIYAFVFGLLSAYLAAVTGNIKTSVLLHSLNNFVTVLIEQSLVYFENELIADLLYCIYVLVVMAFAFYGMYRFFVKGNLNEVFCEKVKNNDGGICDKAGIGEVFVLPLVVYALIYAAIIVGGALI